MTPLLDGIRVLEISQLIAAPVCGLTLADYGASVTKVEPRGGDYTRTMPPVLDSGESGYFLMLNRGKELIKDDPDRVRELILAADVVVENVAPATHRLPLSAEEALAQRPQLVWCSITGTGHGRPGRAVDPALQAAMGMMALSGEPDGRPLRLPIPLVDFTTGMYAAQAVLAALLRVERGGPGALLDCALIDAAATLTSAAGVYALSGQAPPLRRLGSESPWYVPASNFPAADGVWVQLVALNERHWQALATALGHPEWLDDPRLQSNADRVEHRELVHSRIAAEIATQTAAHWEAAIQEAGGFCQRIREIEEAWADPLLAERGLVTEVGGVPVPRVSLARGDGGRIRGQVP